MKFRKRIQIIEAWQWFKHGDVPEVTAIPLNQKVGDAKRAKLGWLETAQGGHIIFPGDWIIIDQKGNISSCNAETFQRLYEPLETKILPLMSDNGKSA